MDEGSVWQSGPIVNNGNMEASALRRSRGVALPRSRRLLTALGDDRLVDQIRRGNEVAFEVVYDRHHRGILAFCRHMLGSRDEAEDAVQQTFTSAYTDLQSNDREIRLKAWLYTIARNRCLSTLRARREQPAELDDQPTAGLTEAVQHRADLRDLLDDMRELPEEQREALVLFEVADLSQAEVARVIGVEPMKVKALVFQARSALIEKREARAIPCAEIREQLATATGGALRRGPLRRHLKVCDGCSEFRDQVRAQRSALALVLPVVPTVGLKEGVLAAVGFGGGAGGAGIASGGAAGGAMGAAALGGSTAATGGGGVFAAIAGVGGVKLAVAAALTGSTLVGGGIAMQTTVDDAGPAKAEAADHSSGTDASGGGTDPGSGGANGVPIANDGKRGSARDEDGDGARKGGKSDDERDQRDEDDDERRSDDDRDDDSDRDDNRGDRRRGEGNRSEGRRRGRGHRGSGRSGKDRGRRHGGRGNNGRRGGGDQRGGSNGDRDTRGNSGSGNSGSGNSGSGSDDPPKQPRDPKAPAVAPDATAGDDEGSGDDDNDRIVPADLLPGSG